MLIVPLAGSLCSSLPLNLLRPLLSFYCIEKFAALRHMRLESSSFLFSLLSPVCALFTTRYITYRRWSLIRRILFPSCSCHRSPPLPERINTHSEARNKLWAQQTSWKRHASKLCRVYVYIHRRVYVETWSFLFTSCSHHRWKSFGESEERALMRVYLYTPALLIFRWMVYSHIHILMMLVLLLLIPRVPTTSAYFFCSTISSLYRYIPSKFLLSPLAKYCQIHLLLLDMTATLPACPFSSGVIYRIWENFVRS